MKIYTRTGDAGQTSLFGGARVAKNDPRIDAYGTVDELNAVLGVARAAHLPENVDEQLSRAQNDLFDVGAQLASPSMDRFSGAEPARVGELEAAIDRMESELEPLKSFILPGGSAGAASLHLARTVCRRAERLVVALEDERLAGSITYLNRLSDYLFVAARYANLKSGVADVIWKK